MLPGVQKVVSFQGMKVNVLCSFCNIYSNLNKEIRENRDVIKSVGSRLMVCEGEAGRIVARAVLFEEQEAEAVSKIDN